MIDKNNINNISDINLVAKVGVFIKETRLQQNKTQQSLATAAGINRTTLAQIEKGSGGNLLTLIQLMRALGILEIFAQFEIEEQISPVALAKIQLNKRIRATKEKNNPTPKIKKSTW